MSADQFAKKTDQEDQVNACVQFDEPVAASQLRVVQLVDLPPDDRDRGYQEDRREHLAGSVYRCPQRRLAVVAEALDHLKGERADDEADECQIDDSERQSHLTVPLGTALSVNLVDSHRPQAHGQSQVLHCEDPVRH